MAETKGLGRYRYPAAIGGAAVGVWLLLNYLILPRQLTNGEILLSAFNGMLAAVTAAALILVYRSARSINFAQVALGAVGTSLFFELATRKILPFPVALTAGILAGALMGAILGLLVVIFFFKHPRLVLTVATLVFAQLLIGAQGAVASWFYDPETVGQPRPLPTPFPGMRWIVDGVPFGFVHLLAVVLCGGGLIALGLFLKKTRLGIAIRASAENAERTSLLGVNVKATQIVVWSIVGGLGAISASLATASRGNFAIGTGGNPADLFMPLVAAVVARMESIPVAVAVAAGLPILRETINTSFSNTGLFDVGIFLVLIAALIFNRKRMMGRTKEGASWAAIKEVRSTPAELMALRPIRVLRRVMLGSVLLFALAYPWMFGPGPIEDAATLFIFGIVGVSLVILTGWVGQISLGQAALVAVGAWVGALVTGSWGWPFWIALPIGSAAAAGAAYLIGIPAIRIRGLYLAVATFALSIIVPVVLFDEKMLGKLLPAPGSLERPTLNILNLNFEEPRSLYYLFLLSFTAVFLMARRLRRSRTGRVLIAIREDEAGVASFGVKPVKMKLAAFALSGAVAGFAGVLFAHQQLGVRPESFPPQQSVQLFIMVVVGGLGSLAGGILGPMLFVFLPRLISSPVVQGVITGTVPILVLMFVPGGLTQIFASMRDAVLRVIATRNNIVVPSLFADYSRDAWERRLVPLAQPLPNRGLAALPAGTRYRLPSKLWTAAATGSPQQQAAAEQGTR